MTTLPLLAIAAVILAAQPAASRGTADVELRWDLTAPGCTPQRPVPSVPAEPTSQKEVRPGVLVVHWDRQGDRAVIAEFHLEEGTVYALCSWDTTGA